MSNIYIQEPPTNGKVLLKTTVGDIDIELWSKEAPLACRNFIQLCMEGYYDNCIFHRLVKNFIVQTGDPTGTGFGGESIYGHPFKDEFHSRLRFVRRGLVAMANGGEKDDNGSQFFFTLESTPELQNKHTIFGKISGKTLFNMLRLNESECDRNERPLYPHKIRSVEILNNPFDDIRPREKRTKQRSKTKEDYARERLKGNKNFTLLSFGDEAEQEEVEIMKISNEFKHKSKSSHDLLKNDDKLSSVPVIDPSELSSNDAAEGDEDNRIKEHDFEGQSLAKVRAKFAKSSEAKDPEVIEDEDDELVMDNFFDKAKSEKKAKDIEEAKNEFRKLKKQILKSITKKDSNAGSNTVEPSQTNDTIDEYETERQKFRKDSRTKSKGEERERQCLELLKRFQQQLRSKNAVNADDGSDQASSVNDNPKQSWLTHRMSCTGDDEIVLARDANIRNEEDWYDIYDPRNPINKRRRNE